MNNTKTHYIDIKNPEKCKLFEHIQNKLKTIEVRQYGSFYNTMEIGDFILFEYYDPKTQHVQHCRAKITALTLYPDLMTCFEIEDTKKIYPELSPDESINFFDELAVRITRAEAVQENIDGYIAFQFERID